MFFRTDYFIRNTVRSAELLFTPTASPNTRAEDWNNTRGRPPNTWWCPTTYGRIRRTVTPTSAAAQLRSAVITGRLAQPLASSRAATS